MPFWNRFNKRWAATGVVAEPTDVQSDVGFSFLGSNPPSVELFNAILQLQDEKDNWLYNRLTEIITAAGMTPGESTQNQVLNALRALFAPGFVAYSSSQSFIVPTGVNKLHVKLWGGGGGGGGAAGANSAGTGGGGGGYTEGVFNVTPGASIFVTIGAGGLGGTNTAIYSAQAGGTTSFGTFCSATGGGPGSGSAGGISPVVSTGGNGFGGALNILGTSGGFGQIFDGGAVGGGIGGQSPLGGSNSQPAIGGGGSNGMYPGGGATGSGSNTFGGSWFGGTGSAGLAIIEW